MSAHAGHARLAFERECGAGVQYMTMAETVRGTEFTFRILASGKVHTIGTNPLNKGRQGIEDAASQAGKWAARMAERVAA